MKFTKKDELGLERTYYVVSEYEADDGTVYIIYTDLVSDSEKPFRKYVGLVIEGEVFDINPEKAKKIIEAFEKTKDEVINNLRRKKNEV